MHMNHLLPAGQGTVGDIRAALKRLPTGRTETFDTALKRIWKQSEIHKSWAKHAISWVLSAQRPLTVNEVCHAFAVDWKRDSFDPERVPGQDNLISKCAGLIVADQDDRNIRTLRPVHDSVVSSFEESELIPSPSQRHLDMALRCIVYLRNLPSSTTPIPERISKLPLIKYAAIHWFYHATHRDVERSDILQSYIINFLLDTPRLSASFQVRDKNFPTSITGLHAAAFFDMPSWAEKILSSTSTQPPAAELINAPCSDKQTPLHWAARRARCALASLLITRYSADVNALDQYSQTPLHLAVEGNHSDMVHLLLQHKANPSSRSRGLTPFAYAIKNGLCAAARALAENKVELDAEDNKYGTPLTWAMDYMNLEVMELLLQNGWDVNWQNSKGWTALRHAAQHGSEAMVKLLLGHKAKVDLCDQSTRTPLRWAVLYGHRAIVQILLEHGADVDSVCKDGETPLMQATIRGDAAIVWLLVERGASLDLQMKDGLTALHLAVRHGYKQIAWLLIERGVRVDLQDTEGKTAMHLAICAGDDGGFVWYLVEKGADYRIADKQGCDGLLLATQMGRRRVFQFLLGQGAQGGRQDKKGMTALHHAVQRGDVEMVRGLVAGGKSLVDTQEENGNSALHFASGKGRHLMVEMLVEAGANVNLCNKDGATALHLAMIGEGQATGDTQEAVAIMRKLIAAKADLNIQDNWKRTALMYAARRGAQIATLQLIQPGIDADKSLQDKDEWTAQDHAANGKHEWVVKMLSNERVVKMLSDANLGHVRH